MFTTRHKLLAAILLARASLSVQATEASFDGAEEPGNHVVFHAPGADEAGLFAPTGAANDYLFVAGSAFNARTSTQTVTYPGAGCINSTAAVTTDLQLPQGAEIQGIRTYYYDMASAGSVGTYLTVYDGAGGSSDLLNQDSTLESGYASEYFNLAVPVVVDNLAQSYVLTANMAANLRFCGMRVFYDAP